ncbi:DUF1345 domain-containing protein [Floridanema aerugineum]|uniref:DUF1345 domain-containing protein n=1 Tax=Floridaenema aerugineum BLCC-F46 TaxID=3153654 RepID=A0ABV4X0N7_9CYAN
MPRNQRLQNMPSGISLLNKIIQHRNRLILSAIVAFLTYWLLPLPLTYGDIRLIAAYIFGVSIDLGLIILMMVISTPETTKKWAANEEPNNTALLGFIVLFSAITLASIALMLNNSHNRPAIVANTHIGLSLLAIFLSWLFVHTYFALHYARIYYQEKLGSQETKVAESEPTNYVGGLDFPNPGLADYWDFLYYSFTIAMCYQTSDISVTSVVMRRVTLVHAIISFIYVSSIIGLVVNLVSNVV